VLHGFRILEESVKSTAGVLKVESSKLKVEAGEEGRRRNDGRKVKARSLRAEGCGTRLKN
jgi:hypothetical protein